MFQRDYILRMIEMMGDIARRVAQLMDELEYLHQLDKESRLHCGLPLKALEELSFESLRELLAPEARLYASELIYLRAMERSMQWEARDELLLKSLRLLATLSEEGVLCEVRAPRLRELKQQLLPLLTAEDLAASAMFFGSGGAFDEMEDALFQAEERVRSPEERITLVGKGAELLRQAANATDETLAHCGMTREELLEAAEELSGLAG